MISVGIMIPTCGRWDHLLETITSLEKSWTALHNFEISRVIVDDSGRDVDKPDWSDLNGWDIIEHPRNQGFASAIQSGWDFMQAEYNLDYVFHLEDDFIFNETIPLHEMIWILDRVPKLAQVVLKRQAWSPEEKEVGGIIEKAPDQYFQKYNSDVEVAWVEHLNFFSTNPCLYRASLMKLGWPQVPHSEGMFTFKLRDLGYKFAFYGTKEDPPWVNHIGNVRTGTGY